jgi:hypothetical protein
MRHRGIVPRALYRRPLLCHPDSARDRRCNAFANTQRWNSPEACEFPVHCGFFLPGPGVYHLAFRDRRLMQWGDGTDTTATARSTSASARSARLLVVRVVFPRPHRRRSPTTFNLGAMRWPMSRLAASAITFMKGSPPLRSTPQFRRH